jgi:hypothetical protein
MQGSSLKVVKLTSGLEFEKVFRDTPRVGTGDYLYISPSTMVLNK